MDVMPMPIESREAFTVNVPVILLLVWAAGVLLGLLRLSRGLWRLLRLKGSLQPVQDIRIEALWSEVAGKRGESIALSRGPARTGAFTFGLFHRHVVSYRHRVFSSVCRVTRHKPCQSVSAAPLYTFSMSPTPKHRDKVT